VREMYENGELSDLMGKHGIEVEAA